MWRPLSVLLLVVVSCGGGSLRARDEARPSAVPGTPPVAWLCRPDRAGDPCLTADLTATELVRDGSVVTAPHQVVTRPLLDCFYVYPTVDLELVPGNHHDLANSKPALAATLAQAARFTAACSLWVPLYRQVTIGTYLQPRPVLERGLALAYSDVERAFVEYLAHADPQRRIVLVGHSQGAEMVVRLLRRFFDDDPAMRERLVLAMPIGGDFDVPVGKTRGGTLQNIPVCVRPLEAGCVVAYHTYAAGEEVDPSRWAPGPGRETACVDPSALDRAPGRSEEPHLLEGAYFQLRPELRGFMRGVSAMRTPFVLLPAFYAARCVKRESGYAYLEVSQRDDNGDLRTSPVDLRSRRLTFGKLGLHILDMQLAQKDLVNLVARRADLREWRRSSLDLEKSDAR